MIEGCANRQGSALSFINGLFGARIDAFRPTRHLVHTYTFSRSLLAIESTYY